VFKTKAGILAVLTIALAGCATDGQLTSQGVLVTRSACPAVAIPAGTGDITLFDPANSRDSNAIDVVANITNVRSSCGETSEFVVSTVTFDVHAQRRNPAGARQVVLPYFATVVQGGTNVVSKRVSRVALQFGEGQLRASTRGSATAQVLRSAATLPADVRRQITRERRPGDADAAIDPLADPTVRAAVVRATFELLVGFQLSQEQLQYNATR